MRTADIDWDFWRVMAIILGGLLLTVVIAGFSVWATFFADCRDIGWMSVKDMPSRCLDRVR